MGIPQVVVIINLTEFLEPEVFDIPEVVIYVIVSVFAIGNDGGYWFLLQVIAHVTVGNCGQYRLLL